jgi:hypothetical protein
MNYFIKGIYFGLGFLVIALPFIIFSSVQAINFNTGLNQSRNMFSSNASVYIFEDKKVDASVGNILGTSVNKVIKNYITNDGRIVDIVILNFATNTTALQQSALQNMYPTKIITGTTIMPAPYIAPAPIKQGDVIK